ncbi:UNVERIFIED_CONTAM: hypothetical protein FKN15_065422 [Acipenser sinensis]
MCLLVLSSNRSVSLTTSTFIVYSYKYQHDDGRVSYPLCFIFSSPVGCKPEQQMMYAGSKNKLVKTVELTKVRAPAMPLPVGGCFQCANPPGWGLAQDLAFSILTTPALQVSPQYYVCWGNF